MLITGHHQPASTAGFLLPVTRQRRMHTALPDAFPSNDYTHRDRSHSMALAAPQPRQNNRPTHQIRATPHPPAGFASGKFFSFIFLQTAAPGRAAAGFLPDSAD